MKNITRKERKCIRYLSGEMSTEDRSVFEIELSLDLELKKIFETYKVIWQQYDKEALIPDSLEEKVVSQNGKVKLAIGMLMLMIFGAFLYFYQLNPLIAQHQLSAGYGERKTFFLPDSSKVILNAGSELYYSNNFKDHRVVELTGEGYFEVKKDKEHPFSVQSKQFKVRVLGTSFSVKNSFNNKEVALKEGKVEFIQNDNKDKITLAPGERLLWDSKTNQVHKEQFNAEKELAWTTNTLLLDNVLFLEALKDINQFYGVKFVIQDNTLLDQHITGMFKNENLKEFISSLEFIANVKVKELQDNIFLIKSLHHD